MIYLNNAATSYPKPEPVLQAYMDALRSPPASQHRSVPGGDPLAACRRSVARVLGIPDAERVVLTSGATEALNMLMRGLCPADGRVVVTEAEHNSVLRPAFNRVFPFASATCGEPLVLPCDKDGRVDPTAAESLLTKDCKLLVVTHCSNVTGAVQDVRQLCAMANRHGLLSVVDASQSAGCIPFNAASLGADAVVFTGHKGLLGPQGTGGFYIRSGLTLPPLLYGGTGRDSARLRYENDDFDYEPGTRNAAAYAALAAGCDYVHKLGVDTIFARERALARRLRAGLQGFGGVRVYGADDSPSTPAGAVVAFSIRNLPAADVAYILNGTYGIVVRSGLQCAPLIFRAIGAPSAGVVRASIGYATTEAEVDALLSAVRDIAGGCAL